MVEKFIGATADYLKFTFGVMLLATVALFLYASIRTGNIGDGQFHFVENAIMLVVATKILSGVFSLRDGVVERLPNSGSLERLSFIEKMILSVASVSSQSICSWYFWRAYWSITKKASGIRISNRIRRRFCAGFP